MNPDMMQRLARARQRDLRAGAAGGEPGKQGGLRPTRLHPRRGSARHRAGWLLIELGIRLAYGQGDA